MTWTKQSGGGFGQPEAPPADPAVAAPAPPATAAEATDTSPPTEAKPEAPPLDAAKPEPVFPAKPVLPSGWSDKKGPAKRWSEGVRADKAETRTVHPPLGSGVGDGKSVIMMFGLKMHSPLDQTFLERMREHVRDDVEGLRQVGYTVVVDEQGTHTDFLDALYGKAEGAQGLPPAAILWTAHGLEDGSVETCDGSVVRPDDVDSTQVAKSLKLVIFASCYVGSRSRTWRKAFGGGPLVVGWGRPVTVDRAIEFFSPDDDSETDLDDLVRRYLLADVAVPGEDRAAYSPLADAARAGRKGDLAERMETVVAMVGGKWKALDNVVEVDVPLGEGRWHKAKVFVVDSTAPFTEGEPLLAVESDIGEITEVVNPAMLLSGVFGTDFARISLVQSETDMPRMVAQGFLPVARSRNQDLAALIFHVCSAADVVERRVFGGDMQ